MPEAAPDIRQKTVLDTEQQSVGKVYAQALLDAAEAQGQTEQVVAEFDSFLFDVLDKNPKFEQLLGSKMLQPQELTGVLDRTLGRRASKLFLNFLKVVAEHGRLDAVRAIGEAAHDCYNRMRGLVDVLVVTAAEIPQSAADAIGEELRPMIGGQPRVSRQIDPSLIGGLVVQVGDTVYDGSVASQLQRAKVHMIQRSIHGISSRRDRFGTASGD